MDKEQVMRILASFSGGKDSILSIDRAMQEHEVVGLVTTFRGEESWFHEIGGDLMDRISDALQIPIYKIQTGSGAKYTEDLVREISAIAKEIAAEGILFGDIDLPAHREWCEGIAKEAGIRAIFPLWGGKRKDLVMEFLDKGYRTIVKKVDKTKLSKEYLGKTLDRAMIEELESRGIDPSGENGEYHTVVIGGPIFSHPPVYELGEIYEDDWSYILRMR